jgi:ADP-heptose:LPS heptosyltransferase
MLSWLEVFLIQFNGRRSTVSLIVGRNAHLKHDDLRDTIVKKNLKKILIFRTGQLGDTLVSVPAFRSVREHFPDANLTLLCDGQINKEYVRASDVLEGAGLIDDVLSYPVDTSRAGRALRYALMLALLVQIRFRGFDTLVYLLQSRRVPDMISRDIRFFRWAGIRQFIGTEGFYPLPEKETGKPLSSVPHETDLILARLAESGIPVPLPGEASFDLNIGSREKVAVEQWLKIQPSDGGRWWIAVGSGSKMPVKKWPAKHYVAVVQRLIEEFDVWPVVFGGPEDATVAESLVTQWGCGYVATGKLGVREGIAAMERCVMYLGNDSGVMHMAVAAGLKCVAIFSARDYPGNWEPYGIGHVVFRKTVVCAGCMLQVCTEKEIECIKSISEEDVFQACQRLFRRQ